MAFPIPGRIVELLRRSTVQIQSGSGRGSSGTGSGLVLNDGRVITNAHVVTGGNLVIETWEGRTSKGQLAKADPRRDLALLMARGLDAPAATFASTAAKASQPVIAVGNPLGFLGAVSTGFVQKVGAISGWAGRQWIQSDLRLAPGNSGGPLADIRGEIVGINTMVAGGIAFSIPVATVQRFLASDGAHRVLGVVVRPVELQAGKGSRFALMILELTPGGPAERASLLSGDLLVSARGKSFRSADEFQDALDEAELFDVGFFRGGTDHERRVTVRLTRTPMETAA
jgi:serine protease Do